MKILLTLLLITTFLSCYSQDNSFYVAPIQTDNNYAAVQDSHLVINNTTDNPNKLFLFLGGTESKPKSYKNLSEFVGSLGYDVINLSYLNTFAAANLTNVSDSLVFDKYRQEICFGTPESIFVEVDTLNSIYQRTLKLLNYLNETFPNQNWNQYLVDSNTIDWSKIIVAGHSQGSGHACYLGKINVVDRVLMFSGPNDYSNHYSNAAKWLRTAGVTPLENHFAYLSLLDEIVDFEIQLINLQGLNLYPTYDTTYVDNSAAPYDNSHCLYTTQSPGFALIHHSSPIKFSTINQEVWTYMLSSAIISGIEKIDKNKQIRLYPNPTTSLVNIGSNENFNNKTFRIFNINGQVLKEEKTYQSNSVSIDLGEFPNGIYFIEIDHRLIKTIKY